MQNPYGRKIHLPIIYVSSVIAAAVMASVQLKAEAAAAGMSDSLSGSTVTAVRLDRPIIMKTTWEENIPKSRMAYSLNAADAIRLSSGLQIKDYGGVGGLKTVNVRGLGSEHTGVFIDGIQVGNAQNAQVDLSRLSTSDAEGIVLSGGPGPQELRSAREYASAAAIYIISRRPRFREGERFHGRAAVRGGSFGTVSPYFRWEQKLGKNLSAAASIEYLTSSGKYRFRCRKETMTADGTPAGYDTTMVRQNGDIQSVKAEGNIFGTVDGGEWSAKIYCYSSERGLPGAVVRRPEQLSRTSDRQEDRNIFIQGRMHRRVSGLYSFLISGKYANDWLRYRNDPYKDPSALPVDDSYLQQEAYLSMAHRFSVARILKLDIATDIQYTTLDSEKYSRQEPYRICFWGTASASVSLRKLDISAGLLYTFATDRTAGSGASQGTETRNRNVLSPVFSLVWTVFKDGENRLTAGSFIKRSFRMPTFNDLYYVNFGNVRLEPEDAMQYDIRLCYSMDSGSGWLLETRAEGYFNDVRNKIIAVPTSSQFRWSMYNIGHSAITGAEALFSTFYSPARVRGLTAGATVRYTFQKAMDISDPEASTYGGQLPYIPGHCCSATVSVSYKGWRLEYTYLYTGTRYTSSANLPSSEMQPWSTHDISLSKDFTGGLSMSVTAGNILNRQYEVVRNYPMPGRSIMAAVSYSF